VQNDILSSPIPSTAPPPEQAIQRKKRWPMLLALLAAALLLIGGGLVFFVCRTAPAPDAAVTPAPPTATPTPAPTSQIAGIWALYDEVATARDAVALGDGEMLVVRGSLTPEGGEAIEIDESICFYERDGHNIRHRQRLRDGEIQTIYYRDDFMYTPTDMSYAYAYGVHTGYTDYLQIPEGALLSAEKAPGQINLALYSPGGWVECLDALGYGGRSVTITGYTAKLNAQGALVEETIDFSSTYWAYLDHTEQEVELRFSGTIVVILQTAPALQEPDWEAYVQRPEEDGA